MCIYHTSSTQKFMHLIYILYGINQLLLMQNIQDKILLILADYLSNPKNNNKNFSHITRQYLYRFNYHLKDQKIGYNPIQNNNTEHIAIQYLYIIYKMLSNKSLFFCL